MARKQKLELTWVGKETRPKLEPRILLEDPEKSYHAAHRVNEDDLFDNRLIFGDNLLALKALEQEFAGQITCVYIDPPYNMDAAQGQYDDNLEHSQWLSRMRDRLTVLKRLLKPEGSIWINIDDGECHYLKILCDEVFGRSAFVASLVWQKRTSRENRKAIGSAHDYILVYSPIGPEKWKAFRNLLPANDKGYSNPDNDPKGPWRSIPFSAQGFRPNQMYKITTPTGVEHDPPKGRCWGATEPVYQDYLEEGRVYFPRGGNGKPRIKQYMGEEKGLVPMTWWEASLAGDNQEAKKEILELFPNQEAFSTPKPERLIQRILQIASNKGDIVLDSFLGSGTTAAVAHKMNRQWIGVELGPHCDSHCVPRLRQVIDGRDHGGISADRQVVWESILNVTNIKVGQQLYEQMLEAESQNRDEFESFEKKVEDNFLRLYGRTSAEDKPFGGGFRYYTLAPSLLEQDDFGNWIINKKFNPEMLAEAVCKLEGFRYEPSDECYWQHGRSTENDYIYVTTQTLSREQLQKLSDEVGSKRSLLICCGAFRVRRLEDFPNLTLKKIPRSVMAKCEWGKDDYSLRIKALPDAPEPEPDEFDELLDDLPESNREARKLLDQQNTLFAMEEAE